MKKGDLIFVITLVAIITILIVPFTRSGFESLTEQYPYIMGFIKTSVLATMGELLASRIAKGNYFSRKGVFPRFIVWGILGMGFVLMFKVFASGVVGAMNSGLILSFEGDGFLINLYSAFMISLIMNLVFAPTFMILHRITDTYIDLRNLGIKKITIKMIVSEIDWSNFFGFIVIKTIPFFWIPAHTITFMLPENYRVLMAGFLSIALGLILTLSKLKNKQGGSNEIIS